MMNEIGYLMIRYFPAFAIATSLFNFLYLKFISKKMNSTTKKFLIISTVYYILWGLLQWIGGYHTFLFILLPPREHPLVVVYYLVHVICTLGLAAWIILGGEMEQTSNIEMMNSDEGTKKSRTKFALYFLIGSLFPLFLILGHAAGVMDQMGLESTYKGLNIPWP